MNADSNSIHDVNFGDDDAFEDDDCDNDEGDDCCDTVEEVECGSCSKKQKIKREKEYDEDLKEMSKSSKMRNCPKEPKQKPKRNKTLCESDEFEYERKLQNDDPDDSHNESEYDLDNNDNDIDDDYKEKLKKEHERMGKGLESYYKLCGDSKGMIKWNKFLEKTQLNDPKYNNSINIHQQFNDGCIENCVYQMYANKKFGDPNFPIPPNIKVPRQSMEQYAYHIMKYIYNNHTSPTIHDIKETIIPKLVVSIIIKRIYKDEFKPTYSPGTYLNIFVSDNKIQIWMDMIGESFEDKFLFKYYIDKSTALQMNHHQIHQFKVLINNKEYKFGIIHCDLHHKVTSQILYGVFVPNHCYEFQEDKWLWKLDTFLTAQQILDKYGVKLSELPQSSRNMINFKKQLKNDRKLKVEEILMNGTLIDDTDWFSIQQIGSYDKSNLESTAIELKEAIFIEDCKKSLQKHDLPLIPVLIKHWIEWSKIIYIESINIYLAIFIKYIEFDKECRVESICLDRDNIYYKHRLIGAVNNDCTKPLSYFGRPITNIMFIDNKEIAPYIIDDEEYTENAENTKIWIPVIMTQTIIPNTVKIAFSHEVLYKYMIHNDQVCKAKYLQRSDDHLFRISNYGFVDKKNNETLYCLCEWKKQKWIMRESLFTSKELEITFNIHYDKLPLSLGEQLLFRNELSNLNKIANLTKDEYEQIFKEIKFDEISIYKIGGKLFNTKRITLTIDKQTIVEELNNCISNQNDRVIIPIVISDDNQTHHIEYVHIVEIRNQSMGISCKYDSRDKHIKLTTIYLHKELIQQKQLLIPQNNWNTLNHFKSMFDDMLIEDPNKNYNQINIYKQRDAKKTQFLRDSIKNPKLPSKWKEDARKAITNHVSAPNSPKSKKKRKNINQKSTKSTGMTGNVSSSPIQHKLSAPIKPQNATKTPPEKQSQSISNQYLEPLTNDLFADEKDDEWIECQGLDSNTFPATLWCLHATRFYADPSCTLKNLQSQASSALFSKQHK